MIDYKYFDLFQHSKGSVDKDWKIEYDGGSFTDWDMESESIELSESLCSETELRFGCCEASCLKFTVANIVKPLINEWITLSVAIDHHEDERLMIGKYKVASEDLTADRQYKKIVAYDAMYDIINADVAGWYNSILPKESSTVTMKQFRESFVRFFGLEEVVPESVLVNDNMIVERTIEPEQMSGLDVITAICEINGCFGHIGRDGKFHYIYLPQAIEGLYPADDLFPDHAPEWMVQAKTGHLYPQDPKGTRIGAESYIECNYENYHTKPITKLQIRQEENDVGKIWPEGDVLESDNCYIIQDNFLVYGKSSEQLAVIAENIFSKITDIVYRPFDSDCVGNPCFEVGDPVRFPTKYEIVESYILQRKLKGIQSLRDDYSADGVEQYSEKVNGVQNSIIQLKGKANVLTRTIEETKVEMYDIEEELSNTITMTAKELELELQNTKEGLEASIELTAKELRAALQNEKDGLQTLIEVTAGGLRTEVAQTYETKSGAQTQYDTLSSSISQTVDKIDLEVSRATAAEGMLSSEITLANSQIVLKADANGRMVQVELGADPKTGSTFRVDADNIDLTANDVMNLMAGGTLNLSAMDINIVSNNWSVDSQGNMTCYSIDAFQITGAAIDQFNAALMDSETMRRIQEIIALFDERMGDVEALLTNNKVLFDQLDATTYHWGLSMEDALYYGKNLATANGGLANYVNIDVTGYKYVIVRCKGEIDSDPGGSTVNDALIGLTFSNDPENNNPDTPVVNIVNKWTNDSGGSGQIGMGPNGEGYKQWYNAYIDVSALNGTYTLHCFFYNSFRPWGTLWCSKISLSNQGP